MDNIAKNKQIVLEIFDAFFKDDLEAPQAAVQAINVHGRKIREEQLDV